MLGDDGVRPQVLSHSVLVLSKHSEDVLDAVVEPDHPHGGFLDGGGHRGPLVVCGPSLLHDVVGHLSAAVVLGRPPLQGDAVRRDLIKTDGSGADSGLADHLQRELAVLGAGAVPHVDGVGVGVSSLAVSDQQGGDALGRLHTHAAGVAHHHVSLLPGGRGGGHADQGDVDASGAALLHHAAVVMQGAQVAVRQH